MRAVKMTVLVLGVLGCMSYASVVTKNVVQPVSGNIPVSINQEVEQELNQETQVSVEHSGFTMHLRSQTALGLGSTFGYKFGNLELLGGLQFIKKSLAAAGESIDLTGWAPSIGAKYYVYENKDRQIAAYVGGDFGKAFIHFSSSYDGFNTTIKDLGLGNVQAYFYDVFIGSEYFINTQNSFSISTELGVKSLEILVDKIKNVEGINAVDLYGAETYGSIGLNYYF